MSEIEDQRLRLADAINGERGEDQRRIAETGLAFIDTLLRKNMDYGSSVFKRPALAPNLDVGSAIQVRISDKIERLMTLSAQVGEVEEETFEDTKKDLCAYLILDMARPDDEK